MRISTGQKTPSITLGLWLLIGFISSSGLRPQSFILLLSLLLIDSFCASCNKFVKFILIVLVRVEILNLDSFYLLDLRSFRWGLFRRLLSGVLVEELFLFGRVIVYQLLVLILPFLLLGLHLLHLSVHTDGVNMSQLGHSNEWTVRDNIISLSVSTAIKPFMSSVLQWVSYANHTPTLVFEMAPGMSCTFM